MTQAELSRHVRATQHKKREWDCTDPPEHVSKQDRSPEDV